jgi:hypothetical protein
MFVSPGLVEYMADDNWRVFQVGGFSTDVRIAGDTMWGFLYVSPGNGATGEVTAGVMPAVGAHIVMSEGIFETRDPSRIVAAGDTGTGAGSPTTGATAETVTLVSAPGQDAVYELKVPMRVHKNSLPGVANETAEPDHFGTLVTATVYQFDVGTAQVTQNEWRFRTGHQWAPRLVLDIQEPVRPGALEWVAGTGDWPVVKWSVQAAFGGYDIDPESFQMIVQGPAPVTPEFRSLTDSHYWGQELRPVIAHWRLPDGPLPDGEYTLHASAMNRQGTYKVEADAAFQVREGVVYPVVLQKLSGESTIPTASMAATAALFLAVAFLLRRGRT